MALKEFKEFLRDNYPNEKCNHHTYIDENFVDTMAKTHKISVSQATKEFNSIGITILPHEIFINQNKVR